MNSFFSFFLQLSVKPVSRKAIALPFRNDLFVTWGAIIDRSPPIWLHERQEPHFTFGAMWTDIKMSRIFGCSDVERCIELSHMLNRQILITTGSIVYFVNQSVQKPLPFLKVLGWNSVPVILCRCSDRTVWTTRGLFLAPVLVLIISNDSLNKAPYWRVHDRHRIMSTRKFLSYILQWRIQYLLLINVESENVNKKQ